MYLVKWNHERIVSLFKPKKMDSPFNPELCSHTCKFNLCINIRTAQIIFIPIAQVSSASQTVDPGALLLRLAERRCASSRSWVFLGSPSGTWTKLRLSTVPECALLARVHRQLVKGRKNFVVDCCPQCNCTVQRDSSWFGPEYCKCCHSNKPVT